jgi:hypothetical protein
MSTSRLQTLLIALASFTATAASAAPVTTSHDLSFRTRGQSLFADTGAATETEVVRFFVIDQQIGPRNQGRIVRTPANIPVATAQAIWQRAIDTCTAHEYTVELATGDITVSPTLSECITGEINRCIVDSLFGCVIRFQRSLGIGIGPKPTQPATRPYDIGVIVTSQSDVRVGFEGTYHHDLGSVDVDFTTRAQLTLDKESAAAGDVVTLNTTQTSQQPFVMVSRYPYMELALNMVAYAKASARMEYAGVDYATGDQVRRTSTLYSVDTRDNPTAIDGFMPFSNGTEELFGIRLDHSGLEARVLGVPTRVDSRFDYHLTWPPQAPEVPDKKAPKFSFPLSFSLMDFSFSPPRLATPAAAGFDCGACDPPLRSFDPGDGTLTSTTPLGTRTLIGGITDGDGIVLPFVNEGRQDVDLMRFDIDVDVITAAVGVPLGAVVSDPFGLFEAELNLLDLDLANFLSVDQRLHFDPNLQIELRFDPAVQLKGPGDTGFVSASVRVLRVGESLQFRQPASTLSIAPVFTLRSNRFTNDTQLKVSSAIQETLVQTKLSGTVPELAADLLGQDLNLALLQLTPEIGSPQTILATDASPWALSGFADVPAGPLQVPLIPASGGAGSGGGGVDSGGGGGGLDGLTILALLGFLFLRGARRPLRSGSSGFAQRGLGVAIAPSSVAKEVMRQYQLGIDRLVNYLCS